MQGYGRLALTVMGGLAMAGCDFDLHGTAARYPTHAPSPIAIVMPANAPHIAQAFFPGDDDGETGHFGIDIWARTGTAILAAAPGRVVKSYYEPRYGHQIIVDHGTDADGQRVYTEYKHLQTRLAEAGTRVARGKQIGTMGSTGFLGLMVHLHFELRRGKGLVQAKPADPQLFWVGGPGKVTCFDPAKRYANAGIQTTYPVACKSR